MTKDGANPGATGSDRATPHTGADPLHDLADGNAQPEAASLDDPPPTLPPDGLPDGTPPLHAADENRHPEGDHDHPRVIGPAAIPPIRNRSQAARGPDLPGGSGLFVGRPFGVPVHVGPSWFLIAAVITVVFAPDVGSALGLGWTRYLVSFVFAVLLYASVLAHELSHSVVALHLGMRVRRITLHFLGGVSEIENEPDTPGREFAVAAAGPLVSLLLAGIAWGLQQVLQPDSIPGVLAFTLTMANLLVAVFNLLPGLPLDGGRLLRAGVWKLTRQPFTGTLAAVWGGRVLGAALVVVPLIIATQSDSVSLVSVAWGVLIGGFVWLGASQALRTARVRELIPGLHAGQLARPALAVYPDLPLAEALRRATEGALAAVVVVDHDLHATALLDEAAAAATPPHQRPFVEVGSVARVLRPGMVLTADLSGEALLTVLQGTPASEYLVVADDGGMRGVLSRADVDAVFSQAR